MDNNYLVSQCYGLYIISYLHMFLFQVLCLSPTYELAIQTGEVVMKMAQFCPDIKLRLAVRGEECK